MADVIRLPDGTALDVGRSEQGTMFSFDDLLFNGWDNGRVFEYEEWQARDMAAFLEKDAQGEKLAQILSLPTMMAPWSIEGAKGDKGEAEFVQEVLTRPANGGGMSGTMAEVIGQATSARLFRKAFFEKVFKRDPKNPGRIMYDKLAFRPAQTCALLRDDSTGAFRGFLQRPINIGGYKRVIDNKTRMMGIEITPQYSFVHINGRQRDPVRGVSDMQVAYWCHQTKLKILYLWATFLETQAAPRTLVKDTDETSAGNNARKVAKLKNGGVAGLPGTVDVTTLESNGQAATIFHQMITYMDQQMSGSVLANFMDLATGGMGHGSLALSKDQSDFFLQFATSYTRFLAEDISNYVVSDLVLYNFGPDAAFPQFKFGALSETDVQPIMGLLQALGTSQGPQVLPFEFLEELSLKVASYFELDIDTIRGAMGKAADRAEKLADLNIQAKDLGNKGQQQAMTQPQTQQAARSAGAVDALTKAVQQRGNATPSAK